MYSVRGIQEFLQNLNVTSDVNLKKLKQLWHRYCLTNHPDKSGSESEEFHQMTNLYRANFQNMTDSIW